MVVAILLILVGCFVYYRRKHYAKPLETYRPPSDPFKSAQTSERILNSAGSVNPSINPPPNQMRSADLERALQTVEQVNRINKLNARGVRKQ